MPLFKLADVVLTDEQLKFTSVTLSAGFTYSIADEWDTWVNYGFVTEDVVMPEGVAFVRKDGAECMGMMFPNAGIYAFSGEAYVSAITTTEPIEQTKVVTKKLDAKYLPNTGGLYYVNPENFVWADVLAAYKSGALLYALNGFSVMYPCRVEDGDVDDSYIEFSNIVPSWGQVYGLKIWANGMFEYQTYDVTLSTGK